MQSSENRLHVAKAALVRPTARRIIRPSLQLSCEACHRSSTSCKSAKSQPTPFSKSSIHCLCASNSTAATTGCEHRRRVIGEPLLEYILLNFGHLEETVVIKGTGLAVKVATRPHYLPPDGSRGCRHPRSGWTTSAVVRITFGCWWTLRLDLQRLLELEG